MDAPVDASLLVTGIQHSGTLLYDCSQLLQQYREPHRQMGIAIGDYDVLSGKGQLSQKPSWGGTLILWKTWHARPQPERA